MFPKMLKLFCVYFDKRPIWRTDAVEPIQAGRARTGLTLAMTGDDTGENISAENLRYGEMTAWYWVWKNYLPAHPELDYVGFCHYRRFLDITGNSSRQKSRRMTYRRFWRDFERIYSELSLRKSIGDADIVMRTPTDCGFPSIRDHFCHWRPDNLSDFDRFERKVRELHPHANAAIDDALLSPRLAMELQFVMRRSLFEDFMRWTFEICRACERESPWGGATGGSHARVPAFLVERFFMVWLGIKRLEGVRVKEFPIIKLTGRDWRYYLLKPFLAFLSDSLQEKAYDYFK